MFIANYVLPGCIHKFKGGWIKHEKIIRRDAFCTVNAVDRRFAGICN